MAKLISKQEIDAKFDEIINNILTLQSVDEIQKWFVGFAGCIKFMKKYSMRNTMLVLSQKPDAIYTTGFVTWKNFGRFPKKGSGIQIYKPIIKKCKSEDDDQEETKLFGFSPIYVFDYTDTTGKPIEQYEEIINQRNKLKKEKYGSHGDSKLLSTLSEKFDQYINNFGFQIAYEELRGAGKANYIEKKIYIDQSFDKGEDFGTKLHEFFHLKNHEDSSKSYANNELEAEMFTALVLGAYGQTQSIKGCAAYLYNWSQHIKDQDEKKNTFLEVFECVYKEAVNCIDFLENYDEKVKTEPNHHIELPF